MQMTEVGQKLAEIMQLISEPAPDTVRVMRAVAEVAMMERERAVTILELPMEKLRKDGKEEILECLMKLRDRIYAGR